MNKPMAKTVGLIALLVAVVVAFDTVAGPFFSFSTQSWGPERRGDKLMGVVEGYLKSADAATRTVRIASGFLGLDSFSLEITPNTTIGVHGKLGGFGDLDRGQLVRVAYEVASDRLVAWRVEVLNTGSTTALTATPTSDLSEDTPPDRPARSDGVADANVRAAPVVVPVPSAAPTPVEAPAPSVRPVLGEIGADGPRSAGPIEAATPTPGAIAESPRRPEVRAAPPAAPVPRPAAPRAARPVSAESPAPPSADAAPPRREAEDAGAVIDWLLNSPPARSQQVAEAP